MKLTEKQKRFCDEYLIDLNATQAAIKAGYSKKNERFLNFDADQHEKYIKELEEEKIAYTEFVKELDREKERLNIK